MQQITERILMHKDIPVAKLLFCDGRIEKVCMIYCPEHLPIGTHTNEEILRLRLFQSWQGMRTIPENRIELQKIENALGISVLDASLYAHGLSLTDCYWYREIGEKKQWKDINLWQNGFSSGQNGAIDGKSCSSLSPDYSTNGCISKTWVLLDGIPSLVKLEKNDMRFMCANEVVAARIAQEMNLPHVPYLHLKCNGLHGCVCPSFVRDDNLEYVPFLAVRHDNFGHSVTDCMKMAGIETFAKQMLIFDLLIGNIDRHEENFGLLRNPDTLQIVSSAPLFDNGYCLCESRTHSRPIKPYWKERRELLCQLSLSGIDIPEADILQSIIRNVYQVFEIDKDADAALTEILRNRKELLGCSYI